MLHDWIFWLLWTLATAGEPMVRTDFSPYDGPLAERVIREPLPEYSSSFEIVVDNPALAGFESWLRKHPIHVRAPGHDYIGWGIRTFPERRGEIFVVRFNLLLTPSEQPLGAYRGYGSDIVAWTFSVLDHYALPYDPKAQYWKRSRDEILALYRPDDEPIDWHEVAERLRSTGRPVPDDLFDQPTR